MVVAMTQDGGIVGDPGGPSDGCCDGAERACMGTERLVKIGAQKKPRHWSDSFKPACNRIASLGYLFLSPIPVC